MRADACSDTCRRYEGGAVHRARRVARGVDAHNRGLLPVIYAEVGARISLVESAAELFRKWASHARLGRCENGLKGHDPTVTQPNGFEFGRFAEQFHDGGPLDPDSASDQARRLLLVGFEDALGKVGGRTPVGDQHRLVR